VRQTKRKIAEYYQGRYFTIETDPLGWKKGKLYPQFWRKLPPITLRYNHKSVSIIGNNCLTIFLKYGRFYLSQPNREIVEIKKTTKVIALDAGIRNFATMFDGENGFQITNTEDLTTLAKLSAYHGKLHKKAKNITEQHAEDGVIWQYNGRN
jgi:transposase